MHTVYRIIFLIASLRWGDWRNWKNYYPTILFFIIGDLLYNFLLNHNLMWKYIPSFDKYWLPNHSFINLFNMVVIYPATVVMFLGNYPKEFKRVPLYTIFWVLIYLFVEIINHFIFHKIVHLHGWGLGWSLMINLVIFTFIPIHHKFPRVALVLSGFFIVILWFAFQVPLDGMK